MVTRVWLVETMPDIFQRQEAVKVKFEGGGVLALYDHMDNLQIAYAVGRWISVVPEES